MSTDEGIKPWFHTMSLDGVWDGTVRHKVAAYQTIQRMPEDFADDV